MRTLSRIISNFWILRSLPKTIYFNFHYLPLSQAIRLPILLRKPKLLKMKGKVIIDTYPGGVKFGMIKLGAYGVSWYPDSGFVFENHGGEIVFHGRCSIGNASAISIGDNARLSFGNGFGASASFKLATYKEVIFDDNVLFGFDSAVMDTDFHRLTKSDGTFASKGYGGIHIGEGCWFGTQSMVQKNTVLPPYCVVATRSLLNKQYDVPQCSLLAGSPAVMKKTGVHRNPYNDKIEYNQKN